MEWDSGGPTNVNRNDRPDAGASRMAALIEGLSYTNPDSQQNIAAHSLGTSMSSQVIADNPGLIDNAWFFGSAGISPTAQTGIEQQISSGSLNVYSTHAEMDWVAPLGRTGFSEHPINPVNVEGVQTFSSDGGYVAEYGNGEWGDRTEGHNAQESTEFLYWQYEQVETPDGPTMVVTDTVSTGYLDPNSESYMHFIVSASNAAGEHQQ